MTAGTEVVIQRGERICSQYSWHLEQTVCNSAAETVALYLSECVCLWLLLPTRTHLVLLADKRRSDG